MKTNLISLMVLCYLVVSFVTALNITDSLRAPAGSTSHELGIANLLGSTANGEKENPGDTEDDDGGEDIRNTSIENERNKIRAALQGITLPHFTVEATRNLPTSVTVCSLCVIVVKSLIIQRKLGANRQQLLDEITTICTLLKIESEKVCRGTIDVNLDSLLYVFDNRQQPSTLRACGMIFQIFNCPKGILYQDWSVDVSGEQAVEGREVDASGPSFNILHISDIHYDSRYTVGANADCGEPMCCQDDQPYNGTDPTKKCGYWIDYRDADTPWQLVEETMQQVNSHSFKYVYYTGDIMSHRVWETSMEKNSEDVTRLMKKFHDSFRVPVFPCVGNHEPSPLNVLSPQNITDENLSTQWLYDLLADLWSPWLDEEALRTVRIGGFYTISPENGLRIISLNSNVCYSYNWWLILDDRDPYGQLQWFANVLAKAEQEGERVHIIHHVPTGDGTCLTAWAKAYTKIIRRFSNIITGQFVGHTHYDQFNVYYSDSIISKPIGVAFNGASVTTYTNVNPSYKIFKVENEYFGLQDYEEFTFNVPLANSKGGNERPQWYSLYKFTEAYNVRSLSPSQIGNLVERMPSDRLLTQKYFRFYSRDADPAIAKGCDAQCDQKNLCDIVTTVYGDKLKCAELRTKYNVASVPGVNKLRDLIA